MLFVSIDSVLEYPTLDALEKGNKGLYDQWMEIRTNYRDDYNLPYERAAVRCPELCKIVSISYGTMTMVNGEVKRNFKKVASPNEDIVIEAFFDYLNSCGEAGTKFPAICGFNLSKMRIPFLIKRYMVNRSKFSKPVELPAILKESLSSKPWEGDNIVDVEEVWKFGGAVSANLMIISEFLGLKKTVEIFNEVDASMFYWANIEADNDKVISWASMQSMTKVNLAMQLMNDLRMI